VFIGHYAVALAAKRVAPRTSLGTLFAAVSFADLLWPVFLLLGWEQAHVVCSLREGAIRLAPHCYNTVEEMERVLDVLDQLE